MSRELPDGLVLQPQVVDEVVQPVGHADLQNGAAAVHNVGHGTSHLLGTITDFSLNNDLAAKEELPYMMPAVTADNPQVQTVALVS